MAAGNSMRGGGRDRQRQRQRLNRCNARLPLLPSPALARAHAHAHVPLRCAARKEPRIGIIIISEPGAQGQRSTAEDARQALRLVAIPAPAICRPVGAVDAVDARRIIPCLTPGPKPAVSQTITTTQPTLKSNSVRALPWSPSDPLPPFVPLVSSSPSSTRPSRQPPVCCLPAGPNKYTTPPPLLPHAMTLASSPSRKKLKQCLL